MAERRMFAKTIVLSDAFLDMPISSRCLYMTLGMLADDDGFVNAPRSVMRQCGATEDDMKNLMAKKFVIAFDSGVIVIKHWRINNYLQKDRYNETKYIEEKSQLTLDSNGAYHRNDDPMYTQGVYTQDRLGKDRLGKVNKEIEAKHPSLEEVKAYCEERGSSVDPNQFFEYFNTPDDKGRTWMDSKGKPVKNWKQKIITWEKYDGGRKNNGLQRDTQQSTSGYEISYD